MTVPRPKHTKPFLIYVPGLISLSLFFPLATFHLDKYGAFEKVRVMEVNWYSPEAVRPFDLKFPPDRLYYVITLTGNKRNDDVKLDYAEASIRKMALLHDRISGLRIHFTDAARYESFIRALDICLREDAIRYVPYKRDIWIFNVRRDEGVRASGSWNRGRMEKIIQRNVNDRMASPFRYEYDRRFWSMLIMILVLVVLSFRKGGSSATS